jgi:hypothetical protein
MTGPKKGQQWRGGEETRRGVFDAGYQSTRDRSYRISFLPIREHSGEHRAHRPSELRRDPTFHFVQHLCPLAIPAGRTTRLSDDTVLAGGGDQVKGGVSVVFEKQL